MEPITPHLHSSLHKPEATGLCRLKHYPNDLVPRPTTRPKEDNTVESQAVKIDLELHACALDLFAYVMSQPVCVCVFSL